ncbi:uncharacterized protein DNG_06788 [Cephalotrichum gorgonifer]|uniref:NACHT-NTPase and P-loop NTPases N-terminal domain-containing protein n=1 Tax=Cephalotrichum gorgonifer TaxID=2041049 RepID=A0AAE8N3D5_9PEZI|nr:uncharacterized protein DNG_06788 [Cephalotrichum gorgonifer]
MDPLTILTSTITLVQAISSTYDVIQHLRGLPNEFKEVSRNLPLAQDTLGLARYQLQGRALDESAKKAIQPFVVGCEEKAKMLQNIFEKVERGMQNARHGSVFESYRTSLLPLGKAHRVEILMQGILGDLDRLATNRLFRTATQSQMTQLKDAIDQLSKVKSSVRDSDFEGAGTNATQNNSSGARGYQYVNSSQGQQFNSGGGKQFNAHSMTFVQSSEDYKRRTDIIQALYTSPYEDRKNRNPDRVPGTCEWFIGHSLFQQWRESESSSMLWVSANPGCGKSVLAKYLVDSVLPTMTPRTTCYFFFKDDFEDQRSAKVALRCILHQLFTQRESLFSDKIVKRFEDYKAHLENSSFGELWDILVMASQEKDAGELVCILDAFDECEDREREKLAQALCKFYGTKNNVNLKFLVTSRPYDKIGRGFRPLNIPGLPLIHLKGESDTEISNIAREIDIYIEASVSRIREDLHLKPQEE